jgi:ElaB/YqjD/DUF883 family membrane-anchored ribosome-binding protein
MPAQKRPEQRSTRSRQGAADASQPQPTGEETYATSTREQAEPERETGATGPAPEPGGRQARDRHIGDNVSRLQEVAIEYFNRLGDTAGDLTEQVQKVYSSSRQYVGSHPGSTVGGAFLFGVLIGFLLDRD